MIKRETQAFIIFAVAAAVLAVVSLCVGKYGIDIGAVVSGTAPGIMTDVFVTLRLPRTVMVLVAGAALGLSGATYQLVFRNPLASPDIIGVAGGANLGAALVIVTASAGTVSVAFGAFAGGIIAVLCVLLLARATGGRSTVVYILSGIVINAVTSAGIIALKYFADPMNELVSIEYWEMGTFGNVTLSKLLVILPFFAVGFAGIIIMRRHTELMTLEDRESRSLGLRLGPVRTGVLLLNTLLVTSVICVTGLVAFVGLIAPHIARLVLGRSDSKTVGLSILVGAVIVTGADILARSVSTVELPVSILTTAVAVPVLIVFMLKRRSGSI